MEGFGNGGSAHGLSSVIMLPLTGSSSNGANHEATNNLFLLPPPPPLPVDHGFHESSNNNNNNTNNGASSGNSNFITPLVVEHGSNNNNNNQNNMANNCYFMEGEHSSSIRAKIMAHPHYPRLLAAYINCHKVGAPAEVVARLEEAYAAAEAVGRAVVPAVSIGEDPALDQFMEAYCEMLSKYEEELAKPIKEAMVFLSRLECQFKALSLPNTHSVCDDLERNASSGDDVDVNDSFIDPLAEDRELKGQLLRKYSGYLGSLKQEFLKKRKKGKLPKEARQQLLDWWSRHYKWPYPSESQKLALAESTGLDQKQINNWFINQRKRHWKPSEEMQFVVMDAPHPHYYLGERVLSNPFSMDCAPAYL